MSSTDQLVRAAQKGDHDAFRRLVEQHQGVVRATAMAVTRVVESSDDVAQQAFVAAWRKLASLERPDQFGAWIRAITRNLGLKHLRGRDRRLARVIPDSKLVGGTASTAPSAEAQLLALEEDALLHAALDELSEQDRTLLILSVRDAASGPELARALGISEAAARQRLVRARGRLTAAVQKRLAVALRRGLPAVAFVTGVMGALPARAFAAGGLAAAVLFCALALGGAPRVDPSSDGPPATPTMSPATTTRAQVFVASDDIALVSAERVAADARPYALHITLWRADMLAPSLVEDGRVDARHFFPTSEELPLDPGPTTEQLQVVLDAESAGGVVDHERVATLVETAETEGLLPLSAELVHTPWRALVALEIGQRALILRQQAARRAHYDGFSLDLPTHEIRRINRTAPKVEYRPFVAEVQRLIDAWSSQPVSDFYRLYLLDPWFDGDSDAYDPAAGVETVATLLSDTSDPLVRRAAVTALSASTYVPRLEPSVRATLEAELADLPPTLQRRLLGALTRSAVASEAWSEAARLNAMQARVVRELCPSWAAFSPPTGAVGPDAIPRMYCSAWATDVDVANGRLAALGHGAEPRTWRAALVAEAWRCHLAHPEGAVARGTFGEGRGGTWRWDGWDGTDAFTACMDEVRSGLLAPPDGLQVEVLLDRRSP